MNTNIDRTKRDLSLLDETNLKELETIDRKIDAGELEPEFAEFYIRMISALKKTNCGRTDEEGTYNMYNEFDDAFAVLHGEEPKEHPTFDQYIQKIHEGEMKKNAKKRNIFKVLKGGKDKNPKS